MCSITFAPCFSTDLNYLIILKNLIVIGRIDKGDFPELSLTDIPVKVDSGAYTSSIHSHDINEIEIDGEKILEFEILDPSHEQYKKKLFRTKKYKVKSVKSSNGEAEERFFVDTTVILFGNEYPIQLSLTDRSKMKYPILIGRRFLNKKFLVNTVLKNVSSDQKNTK